jgi:hypothetical protein
MFLVQGCPAGLDALSPAVSGILPRVPHAGVLGDSWSEAALAIDNRFADFVFTILVAFPDGMTAPRRIRQTVVPVLRLPVALIERPTSSAITPFMAPDLSSETCMSFSESLTNLARNMCSAVAGTRSTTMPVV